MDKTEGAITINGATVIGAVDIGGTKIAVGLVTADGTVLARREMMTADYRDGSAGAAAIATLLRTCVDESRVQFSGIGIGCTGPIDPITGTVGRVANLPGWEGYRLTDALAGEFGVTAAMENDADAAALAEHRWGSGKGAERFIYVTLSTGIGAGVILNGKLYRGTNGSHPELGHHTIDAHGPPCYCGANGCWESLASGHAMRDWFLHNAANPPSAHGFGAREVFALFDRGDALAQEAVARLGRYVGIGLANLTTMLVPDVIALGGGLTARASTFMPAAEQHFRSICGEVPAADTRVELAHLQQDIGLAGAGAAWLLAQSLRDANPHKKLL